MTQKTQRCPICESKNLEAFFSSKLGWSVRSDWKPMPVGSTVMRCGSCSHLFKAADKTKVWIDYDAYHHIYEDSAEGDKMDFSQGLPITRSDTLVSFLIQKGLLGKKSSVLDYGCNRGVFLTRLPPGKHAGFDVTERYRPLIEKLGYSYFTPKRPPERGKFDILTLVHVFEHLESPLLDMKPGLKALDDRGSVLIQSPDPLIQPTDLYVIDHFHHFSPQTLVLAAASAGLEPCEPPLRLLRGELTGLFRKAGTPNKSRNLPDRQEPGGIKEALEAGERLLLSLKERTGPYFVYGAGNIGSLVAAVLRGKVESFIDDNPARQGHTEWDLPIRSLDSLSTPREIIVAVPPAAAQAVAEKCRSAGHRAHALFSSGKEASAR